MFALGVLLSLAVSHTLAGNLLVNHGVTIGLSPYNQPVQTQYHSQDELGQYVYGYATQDSAKSEVKSADGTTRGGYSYIDSNGILQTIQYIADPINGFRVAASNIPQDLPDVAIAKAQHLAAFKTTELEHAAIAAERQANHNAIVANHQAAYVVARAGLPIAAPVVALPAALPAPVQDLPEVIRARAEHLAAVEATKARDAAINAQEIAALSPVTVSQTYQVPIRYAPAVAPVASVAYTVPSVATSSQYHAQDELGQYSYGYAGPLSAKSETKTLDGVTRGGYSYIDANGILQTVHYISDPVNGFRVAATNLPVDPANP